MLWEIREYCMRRLSEDQVMKLWVEFAKDEQLLETFILYIHIKYLFEKSNI